jgi:hypothetical protein
VEREVACEVGNRILGQIFRIFLDRERFGNQTGKVTGNPEAHDRWEIGIAKPVLDRQSLSVMGTEEFSWMRTGQGEVSRFLSHTGLRDAHRSKRRLS